MIGSLGGPMVGDPGVAGARSRGALSREPFTDPVGVRSVAVALVNTLGVNVPIDDAIARRTVTGCLPTS
jgi:hypothetical protein